MNHPAIYYVLLEQHQASVRRAERPPYYRTHPDPAPTRRSRRNRAQKPDRFA